MEIAGSLRVVEVDLRRFRFQLDVGQAAGVCRGARVEVIPVGSGGDGLRVEAEVEESTHDTAWARVREGDLAALAVGDRGCSEALLTIHDFQASGRSWYCYDATAEVTVNIFPDGSRDILKQRSHMFFPSKIFTLV
jgi:hypothetical protein